MITVCYAHLYCSSSGVGVGYIVQIGSLKQGTIGGYHAARSLVVCWEGVRSNYWIDADLNARS